MHDVIVVGGGPAGCHVAARLAGLGHRVLVLERKTGPGEKAACTGIVGTECVATFKIDDDVILRKVNSATLFSPSGNRLHLRRGGTQACILDRAAFDRAMASRAQRAGAEFSYDSRVTGVNTSADHAEVTVSRRGRELVFPARAVVIASGFSPNLIGKLGLGGYRDFAIGVQVEVPAPDISEVEVHFGKVAPGFFGWLVPAAPPLVRVGLLGREKPGGYLKKWLAQLAAEGRIAAAGAEISYGGIPLRPPARTYSERLLVVGDAAGQVKPTSGGGIYYGLIGAETAAATLHGALAEGDLSAARLARYERGWRKRLGGELRTGYWARRLFERLTDRQIDRLFEVVRAGGIDKALLNAPDLSFDWHGRTVRRLLKYRVVAAAMDVIRLPFGSGRIDR